MASGKFYRWILIHSSLNLPPNILAIYLSFILRPNLFCYFIKQNNKKWFSKLQLFLTIRITLHSFLHSIVFCPRWSFASCIFPLDNINCFERSLLSLHKSKGLGIDLLTKLHETSQGPLNPNNPQPLYCLYWHSDLTFGLIDWFTLYDGVLR